MPDQLIRGTMADGGIRIVGAVTTDLTETARIRHQLSYVSTVALGRAMAATLLLASSMKRPQSRVNLSIKSSGPLGGLFVDAGLNGTVRGYVYHPEVEIPLSDQGTLDVGGAMGSTGYLRVIRDVGQGEPYSSTVELRNGEIGEDVAQYLAQSEQTPSGINLGVYLDSEGVIAAGGLLVQVLPKAARDESLIALIESRLSTIESFSTLLKGHPQLSDIFETQFGDLGLKIFPESQPLEFSCHCSRDRVLEALKMLGISELEDMVIQDGGAETKCDFCNTAYHLTAEDLTALVQEINLESPDSDSGNRL